VALGDAIELAGNDDMELERLSTLLTKYGDALDQLGKAHHALALFADGNAKEKDVAKLLGDLEATEETLLELEGQ
jgi:hypothetical protein